MKRMAISLILALILIVVVAGPALAGPGKPLDRPPENTPPENPEQHRPGWMGYGDDCSKHPDPDTPNVVWVPDQARSFSPPAPVPNHGALLVK